MNKHARLCSEDIVRRATVEWAGTGETAAALHRQIGGLDHACVIVFATPEADLGGIAAALDDLLPTATILGCTTAGEIGDKGYLDGTVVAIAFPSSHFCVEPVLVPDVAQFSQRTLTEQILAARNRAAGAAPDWQGEFAMLLIDGLSMREDQLVSALIPSLGTTPLFGGSAGDGLSFRKTSVALGDRLYAGAAVVALIRTRCDVHVFRHDNFRPTATRMVVTEADTEERLVTEINGVPAAREYARLVGKDPDQLSPFIFAAHPVVVRVGGETHVRAIQKVEDTGHLRFFSAIDEGLVLTVATGDDMTRHLERVLADLSAKERPDIVIAFDCILRRLDAEQKQATRDVSRVLSRHGVIGFSTYGEQFNGLHVNQTFTGVAIYPPGGA